MSTSDSCQACLSLVEGHLIFLRNGYQAPLEHLLGETGHCVGHQSPVPTAFHQDKLLRAAVGSIAHDTFFWTDGFLDCAYACTSFHMDISVLLSLN